MNSTTTPKSATKRPRRMAREPQQSGEAHGDLNGTSTAANAKTTTAAKSPTKNDAVLALLKRPEGATLEQMVAATGWLPHTTRAVLTGFKKKGNVLISEKVDGVRTYRIATSAEPSLAPAGAQPTADA